MGGLGGLARAGDEWSARFCGDHGDEPDRFAHAPAADHLPGDRGDALDVGLRAGRDRPVDDLLSDAPSEGHVDLAEQIGAKAARKVKARRHPAQVWSGLGMMGLIGWSVVVPTLLGAAFAFVPFAALALVSRGRGMGGDRHAPARGGRGGCARAGRSRGARAHRPRG